MVGPRDGVVVVTGRDFTGESYEKGKWLSVGPLTKWG